MHVKRTAVILRPDPARVLLRSFHPGGAERVAAIIARILALPETQAVTLLDEITADFTHRHQHLHKRFRERFDQVRESLPVGEGLSECRKLLIGSYFLMEYAVESAALFNPSIVPHPDQGGLRPGALRFVLSLRATGEGHISSVTFRTGIVHPGGRIEVLPASGYLTEPWQIPNPIYEKARFGQALAEVGLTREITRHVLGKLGDTFAMEDLRAALQSEAFQLRAGLSGEDQAEAQRIWMLARSNHEVRFRSVQELSSRVLFPVTPSQRNGIEDARFVRFHYDDGSYVYFATFTAFDGRTCVPELMETNDFIDFRFLTLTGAAAENKGMAMFPRKIGGRYAMLSRQDNENIRLMYSNSVHFWNEHIAVLKPAYPWELVQLGNCGSPMETEAGWLVLSHGVGAVRQYAIGAFLLDLDDPSKVIGRLRDPLLKPNRDEREGYVPNVAYTCGALIHEGELIIPYGMADRATGFATVALAEVLAAMEPVAA